MLAELGMKFRARGDVNVRMIPIVNANVNFSQENSEEADATYAPRLPFGGSPPPRIRSVGRRGWAILAWVMHGVKGLHCIKEQLKGFEIRAMIFAVGK